MCGRATVVNPDGITEKVYGFTRKFVPSDWKPRYNVIPHQEIPVVYSDLFLKHRGLRLIDWNLVPWQLANEEFESFPISRRVNSPRYDEPACIDPASAEELLPLQGELLL